MLVSGLTENNWCYSAGSPSPLPMGQVHGDTLLHVVLYHTWYMAHGSGERAQVHFLAMCVMLLFIFTTPSRWLVFGGAISALGLMTFLSVCLGFATMIIPRAVTFYICTTLLALFGLKMLYEGWTMSPEEGKEEFDEVSEELRKKEDCLLYTSPSPRDATLSRMPSSA